MPLRISTLFLEKADVGKLLRAPDGPIVSFYTPYHMIDSQAYGRMDPSTPGGGLCSYTRSSALVLHCPTTSRTILTVSTRLPTDWMLATQIVWVTCDSVLVKAIDKTDDIHLDTNREGEEDLSSEAMFLYHFQAGFISEEQKARQCKVEAVLIWGPNDSNPKDLEQNSVRNEWTARLHDFLGRGSRGRGFTFNITDAGSLPSRSFLVEKETGNITFLDLSPLAKRGLLIKEGSPYYIMPVKSTVEDAESELDRHMVHLQRFLDEGWGKNTDGRDVPPIRLEYDVDDFPPSPRLSDSAREAIRALRLGTHGVDMDAIIGRLAAPWAPPEGLDATELAIEIAVMLKKCEICGEGEPLMECGRCRGAWYCGPKHQKTDWKMHKEWCNTHALK